VNVHLLLCGTVAPHTLRLDIRQTIL